MTASDQRIHAWRERFADDLAAAALDREQAMAWWAGQAEDAFLQRDRHGRWQLTETGFAFADLFWDTTNDELAEEIVEAAEEAGEAGCCYPTLRKGTPASAFYQALGAADAALMPGRLGNFLVTADEAAALLPELERILAGARREVLVERVSLWLDVAGDGSRSDGAEIVDGVLRVFRRAVEHRLGVAASAAFF